MVRFLPEWSPQWGVMIAWPHDETDWAPLLEQAEATYVALGKAILDREHLLVLCRDDAHGAAIRARLDAAGADTGRLHLRPCPYNDTWTRDYGPIAVERDGRLCLLDFAFNGWGGKFDASLDNRATGCIHWSVPVHPVPLVLEGGSIETDGNGRLLTTSHCLLNPNRNPDLSQGQIEDRLRQALGTDTFLWLDHGHLEGDDTDAHIDTLARLCPRDTIAFVACDDEQDSHYASLHAMRTQLEELATRHGLRLVPLPMAEAVHDDDGQRLPATYANFLVINGAVLVPTYDSPRDAQALAAVADAYPDREIVGVPCRPLIHQHGSLHCVTMQLPEGVHPVENSGE